MLHLHRFESYVVKKGVASARERNQYGREVNTQGWSPLTLSSQFPGNLRPRPCRWLGGGPRNGANRLARPVLLHSVLFSALGASTPLNAVFLTMLPGLTPNLSLDESTEVNRLKTPCYQIMATAIGKNAVRAGSFP